MIDRLVWKMSECRLLWATGEKRLAATGACKIVEELGGDPSTTKWLPIDGVAESDLALLRAEACHNAARWVAELHLEDSEALAKGYLERAALAVAQQSNTSGASRCFFWLAQFADGKHAKLEERMASAEYRQAVALLNRRSAEQERYEAALARGASGQEREDLHRHLTGLRRAIACEGSETRRVSEESEQWLLLAIRQYSHALEIGSHLEIQAAFRLISLWLSNASNPAVTKVGNHSSGKS